MLNTIIIYMLPGYGQMSVGRLRPHIAGDDGGPSSDDRVRAARYPRLPRRHGRPRSAGSDRDEGELAVLPAGEAAPGGPPRAPPAEPVAGGAAQRAVAATHFAPRRRVQRAAHLRRLCTCRLRAHRHADVPPVGRMVLPQLILLHLHLHQHHRLRRCAAETREAVHPLVAIPPARPLARLHGDPRVRRVVQGEFRADARVHGSP